LMALTGITFNQICYIGGLARTSVTHTGLIQAIGPVMVLLLSAAMGMESLTHRKALGMAVSFAGVAVLLLEQPAQGSGANWLGDLIVIAAGGFFSLYTILMKRVANVYDSLTLNMLVFVPGDTFSHPLLRRPGACNPMGTGSTGSLAGAWLHGDLRLVRGLSDLRIRAGEVIRVKCRCLRLSSAAYGRPFGHLAAGGKALRGRSNRRHRHPPWRSPYGERTGREKEHPPSGEWPH